jgi:RNA polymerase sigma-70 factor (ECF subfamily)
LTSLEPTLKALMVKSLGGDQAAYRDLLSALGPFLRGFFRRRLGPGSADSEDLVQDVLLAIHLKRHTYDVAQPFTPWVWGVARYKLLDHFRRVGAHKTVPLDDAGELFADEGAVRRDVSRLLATLPARQRGLFTDVKLTGLSVREAADRVGMTETAAKVSLHRGMKTLEAKVRDEDR